MRHILVCALAIAVAWPAAPAQSRDVLRLKPSSPWNLHYAEDSCRLARSFGAGRQQVFLVLSQLEPGDQFRVMFVGDMLRPRRSTPPIRGGMRFGPQEAESDITVDIGKLDDQRALIVNGDQRIAPLTKAEEAAREQAWRRKTRFQLAPIGEAREAAATWLELSKLLKSDIVLETGPWAKPLAALRKCAWDTVKNWGLDIEQQKTLTRTPFPTRGPDRWFDPSDYPSEMLRGGYQGIVHFRVMVDAAGKPTSCHIQESTRPKQFDDAVCSVVMKRAAFQPALDAQGRPVPSYWRQTVQFRLGG